MTLSSSLSRTSRKQHQIFFWGGRILFGLAGTGFLGFMWVLLSHWLLANHLYRLQTTSAIFNEHIFWHVNLQQDVARLYIRDLLIEVNQSPSAKKPPMYSSYVRYGAVPTRTITPKNVPLPEEYFSIQLQSFAEAYSDKAFSNALSRWQATLQFLLEDDVLLASLKQADTTESSAESLTAYPQHTVLVDALSVLPRWQARYDAINSWKSQLLIANHAINARQLFFLREWLSDDALSELQQLRFDIEKQKSALYQQWRLRHYQLFVSLLLTIIFSLGFFILWWKRQGGHTLFEGSNAYFTDRLTGLFNRDHFNAIGTKLLKESQDKGFLLSVITIQIDQFKQLNDVYGFSIGDKVLQFLSKKVRENLRATDQLSRVGGGEFAILLPKSSKDGVKLFAQRLKKSLDRLSVMGSYGETVKFTVEINEESCTAEDSSISETLHRAMRIV